MRSQERQAERQAVKEQAAKQRRVKIKDDDDEVEILSMTTSGSTPSASRKRKHGNHLLTPESSVKKHHREKRHRRHSAESDDDLFVGQHRSQSDPFSNRSDGESERDKNRRSIQLSPPGDNTCTIFVGNDQVPFLVSKEGVGACDFLANNVAFSEELKTHIELDEHSDITAKDFFPIADFLHKGDFEPVLINGDSLHRRLKGVALPDEKDRAAVMVSKVFLNAGKSDPNGAYCVVPWLAVKTFLTTTVLANAKTSSAATMC